MSQSIRTIKLLISYDGTNYCGWQKQPNGITIQEEIENCLSTMTTEIIRLHGAGRTDAGVHAHGMVAHFNCVSLIPCDIFQRGINSMLPGDIRILDIKEVDSSFHARYCATGKKYQYTIYTGNIQPPFHRFTSLHIRNPLNLSRIQDCLYATIGTHDFSSFENTGTRDKSITTGKGAVRTIHRTALIEESEHILILEFEGDGFLRNMVRNLTGTILEAGREKITAEDFQDILAARDRSRAGATAPAHGLALVEVFYN